ncbi:HD-like signal output (HDOD) domain, no enzymatic activity [Azotobacter beijerinckii]|uniref:HD-like signal output (HDOD) domain, no enzymatic activity n=1 Tax=Azotobacter beijerinckii TaxID=170623 RepID=A0A1H6V2T3_9GAMM|nr:HDOD domain-containing protein [Azotobacter beijerinckii]SEI94562.1 HD-like signal output (HDOD) domain, no enzymatic activity [Azotobacter beijerinckii]
MPDTVPTAAELLKPQLPPIIRDLLTSLGAPVRIVHERPGSGPPRVQAALLEDAAGSLLVLFPGDQLLDLHRLKTVAGRDLVPAEARRRQLLDGARLSALPGLPALIDAPCLYDERLLQEPSLLLDSGQPHVLLEIDREVYRSLLADAHGARFGMPLVRLRHNLQRHAAEPMEAVQGFTARRIRQRLERRVEIPPRQNTVRRIHQLYGNLRGCSDDDVTDLIETDPALAAQVVSWAGLSGTAHHPAPERVLSVEDAIVRVLGSEVVLNLSLGLSEGKPPEPPDARDDMTSYWEAALYTATLMDGLCRAMPRGTRPEPGLAYLAGLLHNFGYLTLAHIFPPYFKLLSQHLQINPHIPHALVEHHLLGVTREQIGAWLMEHWQMPEELTVALNGQHDADYRGRHAVYANLVYLAVNLLRNRGIGDTPQEEIPPRLLDDLGLTRARAEEALDRVLAAETALRVLLAQPE